MEAAIDEKVCAKCLLSKPIGAFSKATRYKDGLQSYCKACMKQYGVNHRVNNRERTNERARNQRKVNPEIHKRAQRKWVKAHPELVAMYARISRYGITKHQLEQLGVLCHSCGAPGTDIDHDHDCCPGKKVICGGKCIRGLLCSPCNLAAGHLKDSVERCEQLAAYLKSGSRLTGL